MEPREELALRRKLAAGVSPREELELRRQLAGVQPSAPAPEAEPAPAKTRGWGDVPMEALSNVPSSAAKFAKDLVQPILHPIDTAKGLMSLASGVAKKTEGMASPLPQTPTEDADTQAVDSMVKFFVDRYGSEEALKKTIAEDPVGFMADLSTVFSGGAAATAHVPGKIAATTTKGLRTAARATDPISVAAGTVRTLGKGASEVGSQVVGNVGTHTGADSIKEAARSGYVGGKAGTTFRENIRGNVPVETILQEARTALAKIREDRSAAYRKGMANVAQDRTVLDFAPIDQAIARVDSVKKFKGQDLSASTAGIRQKIKDTIAEWKALNPADFHTPEGMDALKQKLGDIRDSADFNTPDRIVADQAYRAVWGEISKQAPVYAKTMKDYETTSEMIREAERGLSLGKKASADTAIRKLQSVLRGNVNTNYGGRETLTRKLDEAGGTNIASAAAGQSMNSITPRGLGSLGVNAAGTLSLAALNPWALATLPLQSPRLVGETVHAGGRAAGAVGRGVEAVDTVLRQAPGSFYEAVLEAAKSPGVRAGTYQAGRSSQFAEQPQEEMTPYQAAIMDELRRFAAQTP